MLQTAQKQLTLSSDKSSSAGFIGTSIHRDCRVAGWTTMYNRAGMGPARYRRLVETMTLEERVAFLEGRLEDHSGTVASIRNDLLGLRGDVSRQFTWLVGIQIASLIAIVSALIRLN